MKNRPSWIVLVSQNMYTRSSIRSDPFLLLECASNHGVIIEHQMLRIDLTLEHYIKNKLEGSKFSDSLNSTTDEGSYLKLRQAIEGFVPLPYCMDVLRSQQTHFFNFPSCSIRVLSNSTASPHRCHFP